MIFGAHCYVFTDRWGDSELDILDRAAGLGLGCVEVAVGDDVRFDPSATADRARALGLTLVASPGGHWPSECDLSSDNPADRAAGLAWHRRQVDLAAAMGAVAYTGALYGHPGTVRRQRRDPAERDRAAAGLAELADHAAGRGVEIVIEPMSHFRTHLVNTPAEAMDLLARTGRDEIRVLLDTYHMVTEVRDYAEGVRTVADRLWGIHACENDRGVPGGGLVPWAALFGALRETAFDGYVLMETYNSSIGDFAWQRGMFHDVCPDADAFVRRGLAFLHDGWASACRSG